MSRDADPVPGDLAWWRTCRDPAVLRAEVERLAGMLERAARVVAQHRNAADAARERARVARAQAEQLAADLRAARAWARRWKRAARVLLRRAVGAAAAQRYLAAAYDHADATWLARGRELTAERDAEIADLRDENTRLHAALERAAERRDNATTADESTQEGDDDR